VKWDDGTVEAPATDTGMRRSNNQDSYCIVKAARPDLWQAKGHVYIVADGMGAHAAGELASKMACENIPHHYTKSKLASPVEALTKAYKDVGAMIHGKSSANKDFEGMGTTCSTLVLLPAGSLIAHVGDSRAYLLADGELRPLTEDHSLVRRLQEAGRLSEEDAQHFEYRNVLLQAIGQDNPLTADTFSLDLPDAGKLLLARYGELIELSASGQVAMRRMFNEHLARVEWDNWQFPVKLYPATAETLSAARPIAIDAQVAFGRPVIAKRGVTTGAIADRIDSGETVDELAADYDLSVDEIEEAVLYERTA